MCFFVAIKISLEEARFGKHLSRHIEFSIFTRTPYPIARPLIIYNGEQ